MGEIRSDSIRPEDTVFGLQTVHENSNLGFKVVFLENFEKYIKHNDFILPFAFRICTFPSINLFNKRNFISM